MNHAVPCTALHTQLRKHIRAQYSDMWAAMRVALEGRGLPLTLKWVKGHNGEFGKMTTDVLTSMGAAERDRGKDTARVYPGIRAMVAEPHALHFKGVPVCSDLRNFIARRFKAECATRAAMVLAQQQQDGTGVTGTLQGADAVADGVDWLATSLAIHGGTKPLARETLREQNGMTGVALKAATGIRPSRQGQYALYPTRFVHGDKCTCGAVDSQAHYAVCPNHAPGRVAELVGGIRALVVTRVKSLLGVSSPATEQQRRPAQDLVGGAIADGPTLEQAIVASATRFAGQLVGPESLHRLKSCVVLNDGVN
ncbi:hypothetical protein H9P43_003843 [Blastocladiella emersonii ATCC 22665]|nr:hypothetical protein H9P43_003843 [Blastocladiella emersonii ATCC 22665]